MAERLKSRRKTRFLYEGGVEIGEEEEVYEPLVQDPSPEFSSVIGTLSLGHGVVPPEPVGEWGVYKVYEKAVIWIRRSREESKV